MRRPWTWIINNLFVTSAAAIHLHICLVTDIQLFYIFISGSLLGDTRINKQINENFNLFLFVVSLVCLILTSRFQPRQFFIVNSVLTQLGILMSFNIEFKFLQFNHYQSLFSHLCDMFNRSPSAARINSGQETAAAIKGTIAPRSRSRSTRGRFKVTVIKAARLHVFIASAARVFVSTHIGKCWGSRRFRVGGYNICVIAGVFFWK